MVRLFRRPSLHDPFDGLLAVLLTIAVLRLWILPLGNSFWLDETLTVWTIRDGFSTIIPHAFISLQSIAFCMLEWPIAQISTSEVSLRLLSVLAAVGAAYMCYRIGLEIADRELGLLMATFFVALPSVAVEVPNSRPYALALFLETLSLYWLFVWLRSGRLKHGLLWIACATAAVHGRYLFASVLPIEFLFVFWRILTRRTPIRLMHLMACIGFCGILLLPGLPQAIEIFDQRKLLSWQEPPKWPALFDTFGPVTIVSVVTLVWLIEWSSGRRPRWTVDRPGREVAALASLLVFIPTLAYFALSRLTSVRVFEPRYLSPTVPGLVILFGWLLHGFRSVSFQRLSLVFVLANAIVWVGGLSLVPDYREEDWRSAVHALPVSGAVLFYPSLVETRRLDWLQVRQHRDYFTAALSTYGRDPSQMEIFVLPYEIGGDAKAYVDHLLAGPLRDEEHIAVLARSFFWGPAWARWLTRRLMDSGFRRERLSTFGFVELHVFSRPKRQARVKGPCTGDCAAAVAPWRHAFQDQTSPIAAGLSRTSASDFCRPSEEESFDDSDAMDMVTISQSDSPQ